MTTSKKWLPHFNLKCVHTYIHGFSTTYFSNKAYAFTSGSWPHTSISLNTLSFLA